MSGREIMRMRSATEGIDVVIEEENGRVSLVLDFWQNGTREGAELTTYEMGRLAKELKALSRELR